MKANPCGSRLAYESSYVPSKHVNRNDEQLDTSFSSSINDILKKEREDGESKSSCVICFFFAPNQEAVV
jgi:hypothetical protein